MKIKNPFKELNRFEIWLWVISLFSIIFSFIFSSKQDFLSLIASLIGATALIFVAKGMVIGQILTIVFAVFYGIISFYFKYYGEMITYLCMSAPIAFMSVISWLKHPYKNSGQVEVAGLSKKLKISLVISAPSVTVAFYFLLKFLGNANILFSTLSVTTSFIASYLTFFRSSAYALGYAANDIILIVLWVLAAIKEPSCTPMILCFVTFLFNDLYGFYNWEKMKKRQRG